MIDTTVNESARDVCLQQLRDSSHQHTWDAEDETTTGRETSSSSRSLSPSNPLPNNISNISNNSRIQTLDGLLHWRQARRQLTTNRTEPAATDTGSCRCDDDLSQNKPVRCEHDLNNRQDHHHPQTKTPARLVSDQFCVNCRQLMSAELTPVERRLSSEKEHEDLRLRCDVVSSEESRLSSEKELENLRLRCDVLSGEEQSLMSELREFDGRVLNKKQQISNIDNERLRVQRQIDALTET